MTTHERIPVWVKALDPLSQFGLVHALRQRPEIALISDADLAALQQRSRPTSAPSRRWSRWSPSTRWTREPSRFFGRPRNGGVAGSC